MINRYKNFLIDKLLESVMVSTSDFLSILDDMPRNSICDKLYDIIYDKKDIKTNYNLIGISDKNDEISFIPDSQFQRFKEKGENPWTKTKSKSKIGRMVRQVLIDNGYNMSDAEIEEFVNLFKTQWDKKNDTKRKIEIVTGDQILYWYDEKNYYGGGGTLGNSCMRFAQKNNFMKIYSSNPDKISMVILTDDNRLLARAILWKLDESTNDKKIFLDRIYYRYDNDCKYVHDWVFENVAKGDESIFGSHLKFPGGQMICKLKNVKFENYPYADTFFYLYKRLVNDKLAGDGFISNVGKKDEFPNFVASQLQDTSGHEEIYSHVYSTTLDAYINTNEAAYIKSIESFIYKKDAKHSDYTRSWYLPSEVIYSKSLDTWIPKDDYVDHPKYGIIPTDYLVNVIVEYTGNKTTIMGIYNDLKNNYTECTKLEKMLKDGDEYFRSANSPNYHFRNFDIKFKISDMWDYNYPDFLCFKLYSVKNEVEFLEMRDKYNIPHVERYSRCRITKECAEFYNIPIEETSNYMYPADYIERLDNNFYFDYLDTKDQIEASDEISTRYNDIMVELHDFRYDIDSGYRENANMRAIDKKIGRERYKLLKEIVEASVNEIIEKYPSRLRVAISEQHGANRLSESDISIIIKLMPISYAYYLITDSWSSARNRVSQLLDEKGISISENIIKISAIIVGYELRHAMAEAYYKSTEDVIKNLKLDMSRYDLQSYLIRNYNKSKLYDAFSDLDLK